jgi:hypothetical protein
MRVTPTLTQFKAFSADIAPIAHALLLATAFAQAETERVNAYVRPIFDRYGFVYGDLLPKKAGQPIEKPDYLYMSTDEAKVAAYFAECDAAHRAHGFAGPENHCPALVAQSLQIDAENALIEAAEPFFGVKQWQLTLEQRAKYLDLLTGAALQAKPTTAAALLAKVKTAGKSLREA